MNLNRSIRVFLILMSECIVAAPAVFGESAENLILSKESSIRFEAMGSPSSLKIVGEGAIPEGTLHLSHSKVSGEIVVLLDGFDTGLKTRNAHMKNKYLEIGKFPKAVLKLLPVSLDGTEFKGDLSLHGVTKPITGTIKIEQIKGSLEAKANFSVRLSDFTIPIPSFMGITLNDEVKIEVLGKGTIEPLK